MIDDKFLNDLSKLIEANYINDTFDREEGVGIAVRFINTFEQHINNQENREFLNTINSTHYQLKLTHIGGYYTICIVDVAVFDVLNSVMKTYSIELGEELRSIKYCDCEESDEDFNEEHNCCGVDCDWYIPYIQISGCDTFSRGYFGGFEKDLWKLEENYKKALTNK